ncbi:MAG: Gldg family protein [Nitrospinota bacterium]
MQKERIPLIAGSAGVLLILAGVIGWSIEGRLGPVYLSLLVLGAVLILFSMYLWGAGLRTWMNRRSTRYGTNLTVMVLVAFAIAIFIETLSYSHYNWVDVTGDRLNSLSAQSLRILKGLEKEGKKVQTVAFVRDADRKSYQDLLDLYTYETDHFKYDLVDLDKNPLLAKKFDVRSYGTLVIESGENRQKVEIPSEQQIANAILKVTRTSKKTIYFLKGHGERDVNDAEKEGYSQAKTAIELENLQVKDLVLLRAKEVPKDASVVVIAGPRKSILKGEQKMLDDYVKDRAGKLFFLIDPQTDSGLEDFLKEYGLVLSKDIVIDRLSRLFGMNELTPVVTQYAKHKITENFGTASFFPLARSVQVLQGDKLPKKVKPQVLALTGPGSWAETDLELLGKGEAEFDEKKDLQGPVPVGAVITVEVKEADPSEGEVGKNSRIVVFGNSRFASNEALNASGNRDLFMNSLSWLAEQEDLISIRPRERQGSGPIFLTAAQSRAIFFLPVIVLPGLVLLSGAGIYIRRRKKH